LATTSPTDAPTEAPTKTLGHNLIVGKNLVVASTGSGYANGDKYSIGDSAGGWTTPAELAVTSVDESGGITGLVVEDGGNFNGDVIGQYNLNKPVESELLMMMSREEGQHSSNKPGIDTHHGSMMTAGIVAISIAVVALALVVGVRNRRLQETTLEMDHPAGLMPDQACL
jgi:hypothetical protein